MANSGLKPSADYSDQRCLCWKSSETIVVYVCNMCYFCQQLAECIKMLNDPAVRDPEASEDQLATVQSALDCVNDFVDNMDMVITNYI